MQREEWQEKKVYDNNKDENLLFNYTEIDQ